MSDNITNEEAAALRTALRQLQVALDAVTRERDEARAEVERLRADLLIQQGCCDGAASQDARIQREREEYKAEVERLRADLLRLCDEAIKTSNSVISALEGAP